jgi:two-component system NarL family sensor kinase
MIRDHHVGARRGAAVVTALSLALVAIALIFLSIEVARGWIPLAEPGLAQTVIAVAVFALSFPLLGWIVLRRQPSNPLGWIYLTVGFWQAFNMFASNYATLAFWVASGDLPFAAELSWVGVWAWVPGFTLFSTLGILLFPSGRMPSRR